MLLTGDLVDYQFEHDDNRNGGGNFSFFRDLVLGLIPYPAPPAGLHLDQPPAVEELRVPIFTIPGNHDYRKNPYELLFDVAIPWFPDPTVRNFDALNLLQTDAKALAGGVKPTIDRDAVRAMASIDQGMSHYFRTINDRASYTIKLGSHRIVMLDSKWDVGVLNSDSDAIGYALWGGTEDQQTFIGASPNQEGIDDTQIALVRKCLDETAAGGLSIIGVHAPPLNPSGNERPHYFRETEHNSVALGETAGFLVRQDWRSFLLATGTTLQFWQQKGLDAHRSWLHRNTSPQFFKDGDTTDLLDYGVTRGQTLELLRLCAGIGAPKPVELLLCGHGHNHVEYRLRTDAGGKLQFLNDFYTENPTEYYPSLMLNATLPEYGPATPDPMPFLSALHKTVQVSVSAPANTIPQPERVSADPQFASYWHQDIPPFQDPLSSAPNAESWWNDHRPLIIQTAGLGPLEHNQRLVTQKGGNKPIKPSPVFNGFRVAIVANNVISRIHCVRLADLRARGFQMPWEPIGRSAISVSAAEMGRHIELSHLDVMR